MIDNYKALNKSLDELVNESTERPTDALGLLFALKEPLHIVIIFILHLLLGKIKILSDQLKCRYFISGIEPIICFLCYLIRFVFILAKSLDFGQAHALMRATKRRGILQDIRANNFILC